MKKHNIILSGLILLSTFLFSQNLEVNSVSPTPQSLNTEPLENIYLHFNMDVNTSSLNDSTLRVFGRWSGPMAGSITWENDDSTLVFTPIEGFMNGEWIMVGLSIAIEGQNGEAILHGYTWNYWCKTEPGTLNQIEIAEIEVRYEGESQITCYGAYAGDINNDGYSDLSVVNETSNDIRLFLNDGEGNYLGFEAFDLPEGNTPSPSEGADFNNDGIIDLAIANTQNDKVSILMGDGIDGFLDEVAFVSDNKVRGIGILDAEGDGDDDIITANRDGNNMSLLINDGTGNFEAPIHFETGGNTETGIAIADFNEDGIMDVAVSAYTSQEVIIMLGDGAGDYTFQDQSDVDGIPWMIGVGDVDNDGHVDVVSANSNGNNVAVLLGDGQGNLDVAIEYSSPGFPLAIDLGDIDGDGDLDMMSSNYSSILYHLYENDGTGNFLDPIIYEASGAASCVILHDRDNDGDLDITGIDEIDDLIFVFENDSLASLVIENETTNIQLNQNYPNPFSDFTIINFEPLNEKGTLIIYSLDGKKIQSHLIDPNIQLITLSANSLDAGLYYYKLIVGNRNIGSNKMMVVK